jgi:hypothetical protein
MRSVFSIGGISPGGDPHDRFSQTRLRTERTVQRLSQAMKVRYLLSESRASLKSDAIS